MAQRHSWFQVCRTREESAETTDLVPSPGQLQPLCLYLPRHLASDLPTTEAILTKASRSPSLPTHLVQPCSHQLRAGLCHPTPERD
jgi:hypothetical protein